jgi:hypothetical protein
MLARVARPTGNGYWATNFVIRPGDDMRAKLAHLPMKQRIAIKNNIDKIKKPDPIVSVYAKSDGNFELFYP